MERGGRLMSKILSENISFQYPLVNPPITHTPFLSLAHVQCFMTTLALDLSLFTSYILSMICRGGAAATTPAPTRGPSPPPPSLSTARCTPRPRPRPSATAGPPHSTDTSRPARGSCRASVVSWLILVFYLVRLFF